MSFFKLFLKYNKGLPATASQASPLAKQNKAARASGLRGGRGQSLIEIILVMGLAAIILPALLTGIMASREGKSQQAQRAQAVYLLKQTVEAVRSVRESGWAEVAVDGIYFPAISGSSWVFIPGSTTSAGFTRQVVVSDLSRNSSGAIVESGGVSDPSSKRVDISVTWNSPRISTLSASLYITRYLDNNSFTQTTEADFDAGFLGGSTQVSNTAGGEVTLANNNRAKWCSPAFSSATIDLPDGPPVAVSAKADTVAASVPNDVFVATAPLTTNSIKMAFLNVTADTDPPAASLRGVFTLNPAEYSSSGLVPSGIGLDNNFKTNDVKYYKSPAGKIYALLATNLPSKELVAVQVNDGTGDSFQDPVSKIYKYWTYFNTKIYNAAFNIPSAGSPVTTSSGDNNGYESNPTRVFVNDGSFATDTNSGSATGTSCTGNDKDKHVFYNYDFSVPTGATINGIEVNLVAKVDSTTGSPKICVQLSWDGGTTWTSAKSTGNLTTGSATYILGGAADNWGRAWSDTNFTDSNFRLRVIDVASSTSRDFSLDWAGVKVYYNGISSIANDLTASGYGAKSIAVLGDTGYLTSGGYLYVFDLSNIDTKSAGSSLDQLGCRIQLDGYDCVPGVSPDKKYGAGQTGNPGTWGDTAIPAHSDCSDGGNVEIYADNDIYPIQIGSDKYIYVAIGAATNPEFEIVNVTSIPDAGSSPAISSSSCGRISGGASGWKVSGTLDFNPNSGTEEAANSVYASLDGTRAYISSNGGVDANGDTIPDSNQFYILNTTNKNSPAFLSTWPSSGSGHQVNTASSGYYNGSGENIQMHPKRSLTVLNGARVVLVGRDAVVDGNDAQEYQVLNNEAESTPAFCGGLNFDEGFNDLTSVSEADGDNFVYMVANTMEKQLKIIQGGPDNAQYVSTGTFESSIFDPGVSSSFYRFNATVDQPSSTEIKAQVAVSPVGGGCSAATYQYVGPGGDSGAYFTSSAGSISGTIPFGTYYSDYQNPGQCFRYKFFLSTSDAARTPTLFDVNVSYSP